MNPSMPPASTKRASWSSPPPSTSDASGRKRSSSESGTGKRIGVESAASSSLVRGVSAAGAESQKKQRVGGGVLASLARPQAPGAARSASAPVHAHAPALSSAPASSLSRSSRGNSTASTTHRNGGSEKRVVYLPPHIKQGDRIHVIGQNKARFGVTVPPLPLKTPSKHPRCIVVVFPKPATDTSVNSPHKASPFSITSPKRDKRHSRGLSRRASTAVPPPPFSPDAAKPQSQRRSPRRQAKDDGKDPGGWNQYEKKSSQVGKQYQVSFLPKPIPRSARTTPDISQDDRHEQIWDPKRGNNPACVEFINSAPKTQSKELWIPTLHRANYNPQLAREMLRQYTEQAACDILQLRQLYGGQTNITVDENKDNKDENITKQKQVPLPLFKKSKDYVRDTEATIPLTTHQRTLFHQTILRLEGKDFRTLSKTVLRSVNACLKYYYSHFKNSKDYPKLRDIIDAQTCQICGDGGELIYCDACNKTFHIDCLTPPLAEVPVGDWFCKDCERSHVKNTAALSEDTNINKPPPRTQGPVVPIEDRSIVLDDGTRYVFPILHAVVDKKDLVEQKPVKARYRRSPVLV